MKQYLRFQNEFKDGKLMRGQVSFICSHDVSINPPIVAGELDTMWVSWCAGKRPRTSSKAACIRLVCHYGITDLLLINNDIKADNND
jgi:hypothetical protein